jgi:hypothetical protein
MIEILIAVAWESSNRLRRVEAVQHRRLTVHEGCETVAAGRCGRSLRPVAAAGRCGLAIGSADSE